MSFSASDTVSSRNSLPLLFFRTWLIHEEHELFGTQRDGSPGRHVFQR
jgi:hypothetical protein